MLHGTHVERDELGGGRYQRRDSGLWTPGRNARNYMLWLPQGPVRMYSAGLKSVAAPFVPTDISGLKLWLKADAGLYTDAAMTTPVASDGDVVGGWADQSGVGNHATQGTTANKPVYKVNIQNGLPVVRYDGSNDYLTAVGYKPSGQHTVFFARRYSSLDTTTRVSLSCHKTGNPDGGWICGAYDAGGTQQHLLLQTGVGGAWTSGVNSTGTYLLTTSFALETLLIAAGATTFYTNAAQTLTDGAHGATAAGNDLVVGGHAITPGSYPFLGDIAEVLIYNSALSDANRALVETYLNGRWSIY